MIINPQLEKYILNLHKRHPILKEMEEFGQSINFPFLGPMVGTVLLQYTVIMQAKRILELGSGFGYSGFWFAMGLPDGGDIHCTDYSVKNKEIAEGYFSRANLGHKLHFQVGDALELMDQLDGEFDIILNDMQKTQYPSAFEKMLGRLRRGGLLISDNVLWRGKVVEASEDETVSAIQEFNRLIFESDAVISSILPIRDGISVCVKR
jgi:predicted O-methyltransferase YrrM